MASRWPVVFRPYLPTTPRNCGLNSVYFEAKLGIPKCVILNVSKKSTEAFSSKTHTDLLKVSAKDNKNQIKAERKTFGCWKKQWELKGECHLGN